MIFAFGLARLGERDAAVGLLSRARAVLGGEDDAHHLLFNAFEYRIQQVLDAKAHSGPLPQEQMEFLDDLRINERKDKDAYLYYVVDRLRDTSRILEPHQKIEPYRYTFTRISEVDKALAELPDVADRTQVADLVHKLLRGLHKEQDGIKTRHRVVRVALDQAPRVGEEFSREMLDEALASFDASESGDPNTLGNQAKLLQKALFVAAHYDRLEHVHALLTRFRKLLQGQNDAASLDSLDVLVGQCFRGLAKLGLRDEADQLVSLTAESLTGRRDLADSEALQDPAAHVATLRALLYIAAEWLYCGQERHAEPILRIGRALLFSSHLVPMEQTPLACAYVAAVAQAPLDLAQKHLEEVFSRLQNIRDTFTTNWWYSQSQLRVIEAVVLAVVSDDFTLGADARRWLDDDEYLVRRRVHKDYRAAMAHA